MPIALGSIMAGAQAGGFIGAIIPPLGRDISYLMNSWKPNMRFDVSAAIQLRWRGLISDKEFYSALEGQGIADWRADNLYELGARLLDGMDIIALERRGKLTTDEALVNAERVGIASATYSRLKEVTAVIPGAGDIISFAVREVYNPEIVEAFEQMKGVDDVLKVAKDDITAVGMSDDVFKQYWAAHWLLPSIMQGFEMLHRGVLPAKSTKENPKSLELLMTALDIMPGWRNELTAISYSPYTRVDVRRMHKIGVLDDEAVFTAYADVGFSPLAFGHEHATVAEAFRCGQADTGKRTPADMAYRPDTVLFGGCQELSKVGRMLKFTIEYNYRPPVDEQTEEDTERAKQKDLTKADVLSGYEDGLLEEKEALDVLWRLGYSKDESAYYIARTDYEKDKDERTATVKYLHDAYIKGVIDINKTTDELGKLNLPAKMTDYYMQVWALERGSRTLKPTKAELMAFLRKKIITKEIWNEEMLGIGYAEKYIEWYEATI